MAALLALICFLAAGIWFLLLRSWPMALLSAGLVLLTLDSVGPVRLGD